MSPKNPKGNNPPEQESDSTLALNPLTGVQFVDLLRMVGSTASKAVFQPKVLARNAAVHLRSVMQVLTGETVSQTDDRDRAFSDDAWRSSEFFRRLRQLYLATNNNLDQTVRELSLIEEDRLRAKFLLRLIRDASSPTNYLFGNPAALRKALDTKGASLVAGMRHFLSDVIDNHGIPSQVNTENFRVGKNLATTPGAVVFRNEVLELIQYEPTTPQVHRRPLLMTLAMINKFYALDLTPERSMIKYCVDNGLQLFVVSWANPRKENSHWGIEHYARAVIEAIGAIQSITKSSTINLFALCSGGMTASLLAAYLENQGRTPIRSMTVGVCMLDMQPTDMEASAFVSDASMEAAKKRSRKTGVLPGHELARSMLLLRPKELIWGNVVNNYLLGNDPPTFDLLYWNNDRTNLPAQLHADVIDMFSTGDLMKPGKMTMGGASLDITNIKCDKFFVGASKDHITPWPACYRGARSFRGEKEFVLSRSGHIQTFLESPEKSSAAYYVNRDWPDDADEWLENADLRSGSWWSYWRDWQFARSGAMKRAPRKLGNNHYRPMLPAPGEYVHMKAEEQ